MLACTCCWCFLRSLSMTDACAARLRCMTSLVLFWLTSRCWPPPTRECVDLIPAISASRTVAEGLKERSAAVNCSIMWGGTEGEGVVIIGVVIIGVSGAEQRSSVKRVICTGHAKQIVFCSGNKQTAVDLMHVYSCVRQDEQEARHNECRTHHA